MTTNDNVLLCFVVGVPQNMYFFAKRSIKTYLFTPFRLKPILWRTFAADQNAVSI